MKRTPPSRSFLRISSPAVWLCLLLAAALGTANASPKARTKERVAGLTAPGILWRQPADIVSRDVFYGPGGKSHEPHGSFTFVKEDLDGTNPKFVVRDDQGMKWKVKLGAEARPEVAATRLVWAAGYFVNEDYFLPVLRVAGLPAHLQRGQQFVGADGSVHDVRLKREPKDEKKLSAWSWRDGPFSGTQEFNGLRAMMALINNWDLTDENNGIYQLLVENDSEPARVYMVSDLGSSFGAPGLTWPVRKARGDLESYRRSVFIRKVTSSHVDFGAPRRDSFFFLATPREFFNRLHLRWIGRRIPRDDARWLGQELGQLSPEQVRDAFRAAGYSSQGVNEFANVVLERISELQKL